MRDRRYWERKAQDAEAKLERWKTSYNIERRRARAAEAKLQAVRGALVEIADGREARTAMRIAQKALDRLAQEESK